MLCDKACVPASLDKDKAWILVGSGAQDERRASARQPPRAALAQGGKRHPLLAFRLCWHHSGPDEALGLTRETSTRQQRD